MNPENDKQYIRIKKLPLLVAILILGAVLLGWWLGRSNTQSNQQPNNTPEMSTPSSNTAGSDVKSLVTYRLPDGWKEAFCPNAAGSVFVIPAGAIGVDCEANPSSPIKISSDASNSDDCNDLQNVQNVRKHICISLFINDKKSLKAETIYNQNSSYKRETAIHAYYVNTGKGVIKVEYIHSPDDTEYQAGFNQLAMSMQVI